MEMAADCATAHPAAFFHALTRRNSCRRSDTKLLPGWAESRPSQSRALRAAIEWRAQTLVAVKSRLFIDSFDEQFRLLLTPRLEHLNWSSMMQGALGDAVVVGRELELKGRPQLCC